MCPIEPAAMVGRTIVQWDKHDVEDLGLFKVDLLGLGALAADPPRLELLAPARTAATSTMATVPAEDPAHLRHDLARPTPWACSRSRAARRWRCSRACKPQTFYDLVIEVAIVRPGPIQGDMVHPYLRRRTGEEPSDYPRTRASSACSRRPSACRCSRSRSCSLAMRRRRLHARRGRPAAPRHGRLAAAPGASSRTTTGWSSGMAAQGHRPRVRRARVRSRSAASASTAFPRATPPASPLIAYATAWLQPPLPGGVHLRAAQRAADGLLPPAPPWSPTPSATASRCARSTSARAPGTARWRHDPEDSSKGRRACAWVCATSRASARARPRRARGAHPALVRPASTSSSAARRLSRRRRCTPWPRPARWSASASTAGPRSGASAASQPRRRRQPCPARPRPSPARPSRPLFTPLTAGRGRPRDYRRTYHSTRGHPLSEWRPWPCAASASRAPPPSAACAAGSQVDYVGAVTCRQRPPTAGGVTFYTLEDETGMPQPLIVRASVYERHGLHDRPHRPRRRRRQRPPPARASACPVATPIADARSQDPPRRARRELRPGLGNDSPEGHVYGLSTRTSASCAWPSPPPRRTGPSGFTGHGCLKGQPRSRSAGRWEP